MLPRYIFPVLSVIFLAMAAYRAIGQRRWVPAARTWMLLGTIFAAVSAWLWSMHLRD